MEKQVTLPSRDSLVLLDNGDFKKACELKPGDVIVTYGNDEVVTAANFGLHQSNGEELKNLKRRPIGRMKYVTRDELLKKYPMAE